MCYMERRFGAGVPVGFAGCRQNLGHSRVEWMAMSAVQPCLVAADPDLPRLWSRRFGTWCGVLVRRGPLPRAPNLGRSHIEWMAAGAVQS